MDIELDDFYVDIEDIKRICRECLEKALDEAVYARPEGSSYLRTYTLKNCIEVTEVLGEIDIKINPPSGSYNSWSSKWKNKEVSSYVPDWVDKGHGGIVKNEATKYIELAIQYISKELSRIGLENFEISEINNELPYL